MQSLRHGFAVPPPLTQGSLGWALPRQYITSTNPNFPVCCGNTDYKKKWRKPHETQSNPAAGTQRPAFPGTVPDPAADDCTGGGCTGNVEYLCEIRLRRREQCAGAAHNRRQRGHAGHDQGGVGQHHKNPHPQRRELYQRRLYCGGSSRWRENRPGGRHDQHHYQHQLVFKPEQQLRH